MNSTSTLGTEQKLACTTFVDESASNVLMPVSQGNYPSKLYLPQAAPNSLLGAASALLRLNGCLKLTQSYEDLRVLHQNLISEIHAFESQAHANAYTTETIVLSRYGICALLDETISQMAWGDTWLDDYSLLHHFHGEANADERFFSILHRLCQEPERSVDVLELLYCCLSQGYEGQFRQQVGAKAQIDSLLELVYQRISGVRKVKPLLYTPSQKPRRTKRHVQMTLPKVLMTTGFVLCLIYGAFQYLLQVSSQPIDQMLVSIQNHVQS